MRQLNIFIYEFKHFKNSPFKIVAVLLFIISGIYGLHNGANLYKQQHTEINKLTKKIKADNQVVLDYYNNTKKGPKNRPWVDVTKPFWAIWYTTSYHFKTPSAAIVYNIGQAEQYGFYKKISTNSTPYDSDMAKEIANPERVQSGTLDFSFAVLFLMPLLMLVLLYNIKGLEAEQGFLPLIYVQTGAKNWWLVYRALFYVLLVALVLFALVVYGALLTPVFKTSVALFCNVLMYLVLYLLFWSMLYILILKYGKNIISNTLQMIGVWLLFTFIIPATVHQWVSIKKPTNLMIDLIDAKRDKKEAIYGMSNNEVDKQLFKLYPNLKTTKSAKDSVAINKVRRNALALLVNEAMKTTIAKLEEDNNSKNKLITSTHWFNPLTYFQNTLNTITKTHYNNYKIYREDIQQLVDKRLKIMVFDIYNDVIVDKNKFLNYQKNFKK